MLGVHLLRGAHCRTRQAAVEIRRQVERELRLRSITLENLRHRLDVGERGVDDFLADAARYRLSPQFGEPGVEGRESGRRGFDWRLLRRGTRQYRRGGQHDGDGNRARTDDRFP